MVARDGVRRVVGKRGDQVRAVIGGLGVDELLRLAGRTRPSRRGSACGPTAPGRRGRSGHRRGATRRSRRHGLHDGGGLVHLGRRLVLEPDPQHRVAVGEADVAGVDQRPQGSPAAGGRRRRSRGRRSTSCSSRSRARPPARRGSLLPATEPWSAVRTTSVLSSSPSASSSAMILADLASASAVAATMWVIGSPSAPVGPGSPCRPTCGPPCRRPGRVTKMPFQLGSLRMIWTAASAAQTSPPWWAGSLPVV